MSFCDTLSKTSLAKPHQPPTHRDKRLPGRCGTRRLGAGWRVSPQEWLPFFKKNRFADSPNLRYEHSYLETKREH